MLLSGLDTQDCEIATLRPHRGPIAGQFERDEFHQSHDRVGVGRLRGGNRRSDAVRPKHESPPAQRRKRVDQRDRAHHECGVAVRIIWLRIENPMTHQVLQPRSEQGVTESASQPLDDRTTAQGMDARFRLPSHGVTKRTCIPDLDPRHRHCPLCATRRAGSDTPAARAGRVEQQARRRPMFGILGEHAANQIADDRWQMPVAQQGSIRSHFELAANNGRLVQLRHRRLAKAKTEQQHTKRIDIVGNAAVTPARSHAHGGIGWLEQRGLAHGRRRGPRRPQHNGLTRSLLEHVVEANTAMGHAARLHLLQDQRRWPEHAFEQFGFRPGVRPDHQAWPGWGEADDVIGVPTGPSARGVRSPSIGTVSACSARGLGGRCRWTAIRSVRPVF